VLMNPINTRTLAIALLALQTCAEVIAFLISAWRRSLPSRISPVQEIAMHSAESWLGYAYVTALVAAGGAVLMLRSPACRVGYLRRWATVATLALILVLMADIITPVFHSVSHIPPNAPP